MSRLLGQRTFGADDIIVTRQGIRRSARGSRDMGNTRMQLIDKAGERGIVGRWSMTKEELESALK